MAETQTPPVTDRKSPGVDPQKVKDRAALLVKHGTDPLLAEKLAQDTEEAQILHDEALDKLQGDRKAIADAAAAAAKKGGK